MVAARSGLGFSGSGLMTRIRCMIRAQLLEGRMSSEELHALMIITPKDLSLSSFDKDLERFL